MPQISSSAHLVLDRGICTRGQWEFLSSRCPVVLLSGGFGSGKTTGLALKLLQLKAENPHVPGLLLAQTWRSLWSITYRRLMSCLRRTLPKDRMPQLRDRVGECYLDFGDGVPLFLRSAHDPGGFDGLDVGYALGDEIRHWSRSSYEVLLGRVRVKCERPQICFSSTPAMHWMAGEFNSGKEDRQLIISPTKENAHNLAPGFIRNLRLSYSRRMQKAVIDGRFTILDGAVYEALDLDEHGASPWVIDYNPHDHKHRKTYLAVDPGYRNSAWLWVHELSPTEWVVFDEMMPENTSDDACVQMVRDRGWPIDEIWCDPAADQVQSTMSLDTIDMMHLIQTRTDSPIRYVTPPFNRIAYGVDKLRTLLGDHSGQPPIRLFFARRLYDIERDWRRGVVKDLTNYRYPELKDGKPVSDVPLKDGVTDHSCDAARQLAVGLWLTSPLRDLDIRLAQVTKAGYKIAA